MKLWAKDILAMPPWYERAETVTLYHGTSDIFLDGIKRDGLKPISYQEVFDKAARMLGLDPTEVPKYVFEDSLRPFGREHTAGDIYLASTFEYAKEYADECTASDIGTAGGEYFALGAWKSLQYWLEAGKPQKKFDRNSLTNRQQISMEYSPFGRIDPRYEWKPNPFKGEGKPVVIEVEVPWQDMKLDESGELQDKIKEAETIYKEKGYESPAKYMEDMHFAVRVSRLIPPSEIVKITYV